jgi:DNA repair protein RecN (Recombination protein N)
VLATLSSLRIRNLALVEDLTWEPGAGLIAITGETGAGKSILIGALQLLLGERADKTLIRAGADACTVEAVFEVHDVSRLDPWLEECGAEPCGDGLLLLKRSLPVSGNSRQFINGSPTTLAVLKDLGDRLVDLHGPHDHQSLFSREAQTAVLDSFAGGGGLSKEYAAAHREVARLASELEALRESERDETRRREMLAHMVTEITDAGLRTGEEEELMARLRAASNSRRLMELGAQVLSVFGTDSDGGVNSSLATAVKAAREMARLDPGAENLRVAIDEVSEQMTGVERECRHYLEGIDGDPLTLSSLETRADLIQSLKRKYGANLEEVLERGEEARRELEMIENRAERLGELQKLLDAAREHAVRLAAKLSAVRTKAAPRLAKTVTSELRDLGFLRAEFGVQLEMLAERRLSGAELADFSFAPNPGEPAKPLRAIASSGEISRVMLALKTVLAGEDGVPLLVFDEIDANVGGEVAVKVGKKMRALAASHQVLCITHLPQVAASAHRHFAVAKEFDGERTVTTVGELEQKARVAELARMLGGKDSESATAHARALLSGDD